MSQLESLNILLLIDNQQGVRTNHNLVFNAILYHTLIEAVKPCIDNFKVLLKLVN